MWETCRETNDTLILGNWCHEYKKGQVMLTLTVWVDEESYEIQVEEGANLRAILLEHDFSPYTKITNQLNCGGRGLCATCGVWVDEDIQPTHWHDKAAKTFGYPRLSCQITVEQNMTVHLLTDKVMWGKRDPQKANLFGSKKSESKS